jgi:ribA/ribD-fused uncharacterized protein
MKYTFFWGGEFSNWHPAKIKYKGHTFANSEQAYMWEKASFFNDEQTADLILKTPNPSENKKLGRKVKNFDADKWSAVSFEIMYDICLEKFKQNPKLKELLLANENFVEASPFDKIWGIGMAENDPNINDPTKWRGQNLY